MYELKYSYIGDIEVDVRDSWTQVSADLALVHVAVPREGVPSGDYACSIDILSTEFSTYFWVTAKDYPSRHNVCPTFTNAVINYQLSDVLDNAVISYQMLLDTDWHSHFISDASARISPLKEELDELHSKLAINNIIPIGSVVLNDNAPTIGTWKELSECFISEFGNSAYAGEDGVVTSNPSGIVTAPRNKSAFDELEVSTRNFSSLNHTHDVSILGPKGEQKMSAQNQSFISDASRLPVDSLVSFSVKGQLCGDNWWNRNVAIPYKDDGWDRVTISPESGLAEEPTPVVGVRVSPVVGTSEKSYKVCPDISILQIKLWVKTAD